MVAAVAQIVVLDDLLDAHKPLVARLDLLEQFSEVAMCLTATALNLVVIVAVSRDEVDNDLVGHEVLPVCAGNGAAVVEHHLGAAKVAPTLLEQMLDLDAVSYGVDLGAILPCSTRTEWFLSCSTVSEAEDTISAMGGYDPPAPLLPPLEPFAPLTCAPFALLYPFMAEMNAGVG